jgi:hypothetical protein
MRRLNSTSIRAATRTTRDGAPSSRRSWWKSLSVAAVLGLSAASGLNSTALADPATLEAAASAATEASLSRASFGKASKTSGMKRTGDAQRLVGEAAQKRNLEILKKGMDEFSKVPCYEAKLFKQEEVNGELLAEDEIDVKVGHAPFGVYMKWRTGEKGQQAIYMEGENDNQLLVQPGGLKGRLAGVLKFDPQGEMAMACSRHPVTRLGMLALAKTIVDYTENDIRNKADADMLFESDAMFEDRPCFHFVAVYKSPQADHPYRKCDMFIDKEYLMPVQVKNYRWGENGEDIGDDDSLIESYAYTEITPCDSVDPSDFSPKNRRYAMRMK